MRGFCSPKKKMHSSTVPVLIVVHFEVDGKPIPSALLERVWTNRNTWEIALWVNIPASLQKVHCPRKAIYLYHFVIENYDFLKTGWRVSGNEWMERWGLFLSLRPTIKKGSRRVNVENVKWIIFLDCEVWEEERVYLKLDQSFVSISNWNYKWFFYIVNQIKLFFLK